MRKANRSVVGPLHLRVMRAVADANARYGDPDLHLDGGTALAAYFLGHRESEDLDFFGGRGFNAASFGSVLETIAGPAGLAMEHLAEPTLGFARYFVRDTGAVASGTVKVDLAAASPFRLAPLEPTDEGPPAASYRDLCAGKLHAACDRFERRDFVDVHAILRTTQSGLNASDDEARRRFRSLVEDLLVTDPGLDARIIGQGLGRALGRKIVADFPLRLLVPITDDEIQETLQLCFDECTRLMEEALDS